MCKAWCYGSQGGEAPNHQPGGYQQDKRKGHLRDDKRILGPEPTGPLGGASCALDPAGETGPEDRGQSEQEARPQGAYECKCQGCSVYRYLLKPGKSGGPLRDQHLEACIGKRQAERAAKDAQGQTLHHEFARNSSPTGAKRRANRKLLPPGLRPHEHEVRYVCANQQQHAGKREARQRRRAGGCFNKCQRRRNRQAQPER